MHDQESGSGADYGDVATVEGDAVGYCAICALSPASAMPAKTLIGE